MKLAASFESEKVLQLISSNLNLRGNTNPKLGFPLMAGPITMAEGRILKLRRGLKSRGGCQFKLNLRHPCCIHVLCGRVIYHY